MKKLLLILLIITYSCGDDRLPIEDERLPPYVVIKINKYSKTHSHYYINNGTNYLHYINEYELILPRGRYMVGDTIIIKTYKK